MVAARVDVDVAVRVRLVDHVGLRARVSTRAAEEERVQVAVDSELGEASSSTSGVGISLSK